MAGFPSNIQNRWGRQGDYKQKLPRARSQQESISQNLEFTLKYLHHIETLSRDVVGPEDGRQNEFWRQKVGSSSGREKKIMNSNHAV